MKSLKPPQRPFGVREWQAALFRLRHPNGGPGPVKGRLREPSISGTTWPLEAMTTAVRPRVIHNQSRK